MSKLVANAILTVVLAALCVLVLFGFNRAAAPQAVVLPVEGAREPDYAAVLRTASREAFRSDLEALCKSPTRFSGTEGCEAAADFLAESLRGLGYDVLEQPVAVTVPSTRRAEIRDASGEPLPGVSIHPFLPNWFRTVSTPPEGISGDVHLSEKGLAREFSDVDLEGNFALLPLGIGWSTVAGMGAKAVLYYDDGNETIGGAWSHHVDASLDVPRFLVTGAATNLQGRSVRVTARVDFEEKRVRNIIGLLDVPNSEEAVILTSFYDSYSYVPDAAPGAEQATAPAAMLAAARQLAGEADELRRSVIMLATAGHAQGLFGIREFLRSLGTRERRQAALDETVEQRDAAAAALQLAEHALEVARDASYWSAAGREAEEAYWATRGDTVREAFLDVLMAALDVGLMEAVEDLTDARVDWVREGLPVRGGDGEQAPSFERYNAARERQARIQAIMATPAGRIKDQWAEYVTEQDLPARVVEVTAGRVAALERRRAEAEIRLDLGRRMVPYKRVFVLGLDLSSRGEQLGMVCGDINRAQTCIPADTELAAQLMSAGSGLDQVAAEAVYGDTRRKLPRVVNLLRKKDCRDLEYITAWYAAPLYFESTAALWAGHTAFTLSTLGDSRSVVGTPLDTLDRITAPAETEASAEREEPLDSLCVSARLIAATVSRWARGHGRIVPISSRSELHTVRGQVVSQIGENLTPDHTMAGALVRFGPLMHSTSPRTMPPGMGKDICLTADWEGKFELPFIWGPALSTAWRATIEIDAAVVRPEDGTVTWTLSTPKSGKQAPYSTTGVKIAQFDKSLAMPVVFRAAPMQIIPMNDPATLQPYTDFNFIETKSLAPPKEYKVEKVSGAYVCYVPPESRLYFTFKKGKKTNPNLMEVRAFALGAVGAADGSQVEEPSEIVGEGYLAADSPRVVNVELDAAVSMAQVNARRTRLQARYDMTDDMVLSYNAKAVALAEEARRAAAAGNMVDAKRRASASVAYSSNIHSVIRKNASDAIIGILFYLFLAVPFAIFMEKLLIGHPDLRYQIAFQGVIFIIFFLALRYVHPAYQLVRSSFMILLGFITFSLAAMVSSFVSSRFKKNIGELHQKVRQQTEVADVSRAGATATAFVLGLNHMRKRPVRTGLTVGTLILTTFVMLCFTSISTDQVDIEFPLGKSTYTGLLIRDRNFRTVRSALNAVRELYGQDHIVSPRNWGGTFTVAVGTTPVLPEYTITRDREEQSFEVKANAVLGLSPYETQLTPLTNAFETLVRWFETDSELACFLPQFLADQLRITAHDITEGDAHVRIGGREYTVLGIFDPRRFADVLDIDGESLLPLDILSMQDPSHQTAAVSEDEASEIPEDLPRLDGQVILITPCESMPANTLTASIAVGFRGLDYAGARDLVTTHLERSAEPTYWGIDGVAFYGGKLRMQSMEGLLDLLLPIIIAAMTVLNTMRGSVYERQDELYVFNAVGLSPTHIRSLFLAEASVYSVVGAVGGYLLAQGIGTGLRAAGMTAGLTMNYSSLSCVFVSVIIMVVVFVSSVFPARMAARLAAPAEMMTRERSTAAGDIMELDLPFTFSRRDRVAIIPYFLDWFENFGEGSSGEYFCTPPQPGILADEAGRAAPFIDTTTWLKPYDLGVSQSVQVVVRHLPETGDNIATVLMTRLSGNAESWERCCHAFIGLLRKRFLTWRAVPGDARDALFERGRKLLIESTETRT